MTTRQPGTGVTLLCCLLTLATSASAEGAWVMWMGPMNPPPGTKTWEMWSSMHSYETLELCKADAERNDQHQSLQLRLPPRHRGPAWAEGDVTRSRRT